MTNAASHRGKSSRQKIYTHTTAISLSVLRAIEVRYEPNLRTCLRIYTHTTTISLSLLRAIEVRYEPNLLIHIARVSIKVPTCSEALVIFRRTWSSTPVTAFVISSDRSSDKNLLLSRSNTSRQIWECRKILIFAWYIDSLALAT